MDRRRSPDDGWTTPLMDALHAPVDRRQATVVLAPPSPPSAPHLGTVYTWSLLDAATRALRGLGREAILPESWNLASRRLDHAIRSAADSENALTEHATMVSAAVNKARADLAAFNVHPDRQPALRDDDPAIADHVRAAVLDLAYRGLVARQLATEKWCPACGIAMPPTSVLATCFVCGGGLRQEEREDWFLRLDFPAILEHASQTRWIPEFAARRFADLGHVHPLYRVGHLGRQVGIRSPLDETQTLDQRLVAALYPSVLRRMGFSGPIVTGNGQDIQRKWLLLVFAANSGVPAVDVVISHGLLLSSEGRKMSRYAGASLDDLRAEVDPALYRAALLGMPLGRDFRANSVPAYDASRLREKVRNTVRFLGCASSEHIPSSVDLAATLGPDLDHVESLLVQLEIREAYRAFRHTIRDTLSKRLIPQVRSCGCTHADEAIDRIRSLAAVFFGCDVCRLGESANVIFPSRRLHDLEVVLDDVRARASAAS